MKKLSVFFVLLLALLSLPQIIFAQVPDLRDTHPCSKYPLLDGAVVPSQKSEIDPRILLIPKKWDCDPGILLPAINDDIDPGIIFDPWHEGNKVPFIRMPEVSPLQPSYHPFNSLQPLTEPGIFLDLPHPDLMDLTPHFYLDKGFRRTFPSLFNCTDDDLKMW